MKKAILIGLIGVLFFNSAGYLIVYQFRRSVIRSEMKSQIKNGIPDNELVIITITKENSHQVDWKEKHEFRYQGKMYDVVRSTIATNGTHQYFCITDEQETTLFNHLDELVLRQMKSNKHNRTNKGFYFVGSLVYLEHISKFAIYLSGSEFLFHSFSLSYQSPVFEIQLPPPNTKSKNLVLS